jgi:hypothetical protein
VDTALPYGYRLTDDGVRLSEDPSEQKVIHRTHCLSVGTRLTPRAAIETKQPPIQDCERTLVQLSLKGKPDHQIETDSVCS